MRVDNQQAGQQLQKAQSTQKTQETKNAKVNSESKTSESAKPSEAQISARAKEMALAKRVATDTGSVREAKIAELKARIANRDYNVKPEDVANKLVKEHLKTESN